MAATLGSARDRLLFLIGIYTGFRVHELLAVRVGDVWKNGRPATELTLSRQLLKGGAGAKPEWVRSRTAPLHPAL
jgi:integrase